MKAKNISGRLARILAMLLVMILISGCMAVPVALGQEVASTTDPLEESTATYSILYMDEHSPYIEYMLNSEYSDRMDVTSPYCDEEFVNSIPDDSTVIYFIVGENGVSITGTPLLIPDMIFFFNACYPFENRSPESSGEDWSVVLLNYLSQGTDLYVYLLSDDSGFGEMTRLTVNMLLDTLLDTEDLEYHLEEISENVYSLNDSSDKELGILHVIDLDEVTIEYENDYFGPWTYVFEDMLIQLGIVEPEPEEATEPVE